MRIDLVNGATYFPSRIAQKQSINSEPGPGTVNSPKTTEKLSNIQLDGLNPQEANLLQKLFGELNQAERKDLSKSVRPGQFIDITA